MKDTGIAAALAAGRSAMSKKSRWEPVGVAYRGHLIAEVRDHQNDKTERVHLFRGETLYYGVAGTSDDPIVHRVSDRALKKIVRAMIHPDAPHWGDALNEAHKTSVQDTLDRVGRPSKPQRRKR